MLLKDKVVYLNRSEISLYIFINAITSMKKYFTPFSHIRHQIYGRYSLEMCGMHTARREPQRRNRQMFRRIKYQNNHVCLLTNEFSTLNIRINEYLELESVITRDSGFGSQPIRNMLNKHCTQIIAYYDRYDIYITYKTHQTHHFISTVCMAIYIYINMCNISSPAACVRWRKTNSRRRTSVRPGPGPQSGHAYTIP